MIFGNHVRFVIDLFKAFEFVEVLIYESVIICECPWDRFEVHQTFVLVTDDQLVTGGKFIHDPFPFFKRVNCFDLPSLKSIEVPEVPSVLGREEDGLPEELYCPERQASDWFRLRSLRWEGRAEYDQKAYD